MHLHLSFGWVIGQCIIYNRLYKISCTFTEYSRDIIQLRAPNKHFLVYFRPEEIKLKRYNLGQIKD
ncbi:MAG: hypothetical protein DA329_05775 [Candidatus Nitrosocosmicus sp.]|nr:hypothetical protein [Candidatus Nitrosocosmicus sp.]